MIAFALACDACGEPYGDLSPLTLDDARDLANDNGWRCDAAWDLCPEHVGLSDEEIRLRSPF